MRNLERKIGALCRAVAVKVAEKRPDLNNIIQKSDDTLKIKNVMNGYSKMKKIDLPHPPEVPIMLDEHAVEDILGVRC